MVPQLVAICATYSDVWSMVIGGGDANVWSVPLPAFTSAHVTSCDVESSPWRSLIPANTRPTITTAMPTLRAVRVRFWRCSALRIASRRISRLILWRSRLVALGTAAQSTEETVRNCARVSMAGERSRPDPPYTDRASDGLAGTIRCREPGGPEVRRHLGRRSRSNPCRRRAHRSYATQWRRRRGRRLRDGQDH